MLAAGLVIGLTIGIAAAVGVLVGQRGSLPAGMPSPPLTAAWYVTG